MAKKEQKKSKFKKNQFVLAKQPKRDRITYCTMMNEPLKAPEGLKVLLAANENGINNDAGRCYTSRGQVKDCDPETKEKILNSASADTFNQINVLHDLGNKVLELTGDESDGVKLIDIANMMAAHGISVQYLGNFMRCDGRQNNAKYDTLGFLKPVAYYFEKNKEEIKRYYARTALARRVYKRR